MAEFTWVLLDAEGKELSTSQTFASKEEAEAWMGVEWSNLVEQGGESVSLREDDTQVYRMGLGEA